MSNWSPDEQFALLNWLMREQIQTAMPRGMGACLILFPLNSFNGLVSYASNSELTGMREMLGKLLAKWDADAAEREARDGR